MSPSERSTALDAVIDHDAEQQTPPLSPAPPQSRRRVFRTKGMNGSSNSTAVVWRKVGAMAMDPDQPYNPRLGLWAKAGLGLAAGVCLNNENGCSGGIVVFMARDRAVPSKLQSDQNVQYMVNGGPIHIHVCMYYHMCEW